MTVTLVCDPSEAMELCASQQLYLKPVAKLTISVMLPEHASSLRAFSKWEVIDKLKNMICPDQFTSVKVSKSTKGVLRFEGEAETKRLVGSLKEKLHGKMIKLNGFKEDLQVVATEALLDFPAPQDLEADLSGRGLLGEDSAEPRREVPDCIHLEGLPCKWFALKGSDSETPSEEVLREVFGSFGKIKNIDIPMLDPYREEVVRGSKNNFLFRGWRTFDAFVQYQESASFSKAMEALKGMKLMFKGDDGKALACNIKVTSDTTRHFSETAINQRNLERLTLQGLERERKREESRGKKGTERKRHDDDDGDDGDGKKDGEGKRKFKIKRRGKRQMDRDEKRPRKQPKVTAGEEPWPENMPEWEERKYLLAQRRVESIRLLTVLLSQIKNFVLSSRQMGEHPADPESEREGVFPTPAIEKALKQKANVCSLGHLDKKKPKRRLAELGNSHVWEGEEEECATSEEPASPLPLIRTVLNKPVARVITSQLTEKDTDGRRTGGLLQVTVMQDCNTGKAANRADDPCPNLGCFSEGTHASKGKKQKVYETEEFIHYLLNYYQTPRYARICPVVQSPVDKSWWQRVVSCSGNGFQVSLKNKVGKCFTKLSLVPNLQERDSGENDSNREKMIDKEPEPVQMMPKSRACAREFAKNYEAPWDDSLEEATDKTTHVEWSTHVVGCPCIPCDIKYQEENTGMTVATSQKPLGRLYKLKDLLEEISSDSEYFSEALTEPLNKTERRNGGCRSSSEVWPLSPRKARKLLICVQNVACGNQDGGGPKRSFCSSAEYYDSTKNPRQRLKTTFRRPSGNGWHKGQPLKWPSSEDEREASRKKKRKKKKRSPSNSWPDDESSFLKANHCGELESLSKAQRKGTTTFHDKTKCKTDPAVKAKDAIHLSASHLQEGHQGPGDFLLRREMGADSEGWPLFPVEIVQARPCPESLCGADLERGC